MFHLNSIFMVKDFRKNACRVILFSHKDEKFSADYCDVGLFNDFGIVKPTGLKLNRRKVAMYFAYFTKFFGVDYFDTLSRCDMCKLIFCFLCLGMSSAKAVVVSFKEGKVVNYKVIF